MKTYGPSIGNLLGKISHFSVGFHTGKAQILVINTLSVLKVNHALFI
jgi:hypothetical protein